jgi:hypothetical protein
MNTWIKNSGNRPVVSLKRKAEPGEPFLYDNKNLLPYVGRPGWGIEYLDAEGDWTETSLWKAVNTEHHLLFKLLKNDTGCYRARFTPLQGPRFIYPTAEVCEEEFRWDNSTLLGVIALGQERYFLEEYNHSFSLSASISGLTWSMHSLENHSAREIIGVTNDRLFRLRESMGSPVVGRMAR